MIPFQYSTQIQWGGNSAPWHDNGIFILGQAGGPPVAIDIASTVDGKTLNGTITFAGSAPTDIRAEQQGSTATYRAEIKRGGAWQSIGDLTFNAPVANFKANSTDNGVTLSGVLGSVGSGGVGFKATLKNCLKYDTQIQWGGNDAPWHNNGLFILGQSDQLPVSIKFSVAANGSGLVGVWTSFGAGGVDFRATQQGTSAVYSAEIQWGGSQAPWHPLGVFIFNAPVGHFTAESTDQGKTLSGILQSIGSGGVGFRAKLT